MKNIFLVFLLLTLVLPQTVAARSGVDRDDLDDEIEAEISVPVLFFSVEDIVPDFGSPRGGGMRTHEGQDFLAPEGTPIVSPTEAIVIGTGEWRGGGNYVQTANPGGETFRYMHLDSVADLDRGDELKPGDFIGTVGDTGNAPDGVYHLHFEILDEDGEPIDPAERVVNEFNLREQIRFLRDIFREIRNDDEYARFLVDTYPTEFRTAYEEGWNLPREIDEELEDLDYESEFESEQALRAVLGQIPAVVQSGLKSGDDGVLVSLLQLYLIYSSEGDARDRLAAAGPTGYFGSITTNALIEFQAEKEVPETGVYDTRTRGEMLERIVVLNLN